MLKVVTCFPSSLKQEHSLKKITTSQSGKNSCHQCSCFYELKKQETHTKTTFLTTNLDNYINKIICCSFIKVKHNIPKWSGVVLLVFLGFFSISVDIFLKINWQISRWPFSAAIWSGVNPSAHIGLTSLFISV